jgi:hypothetical protein
VHDCKPPCYSYVFTACMCTCMSANLPFCYVSVQCICIRAWLKTHHSILCVYSMYVYMHVCKRTILSGKWFWRRSMIAFIKFMSLMYVCVAFFTSILYVCIYVYIYIYTYVCTHTHIYATIILPAAFVCEISQSRITTQA